jgi:hypothetical protein
MTVAHIQKYFEKFHETIRTDYDTNAELREKRDILLDKIQKSLGDAKRPSFERLMQGSYIMRTGVLPVGGKEYDIDVGLRFRIRPEDQKASDVRSWVLSAVHDHTDKVETKGSCIRVRYATGFHVDLVSYAWWTEDGIEQYRLGHDSKGWLPANPPGLLTFVQDAQANFADTDGSTQTTQLRRVIRYLKRWDDVWQPDESSAKPSGLAFTLLSIERLAKTLDWDAKPDDRVALRHLAEYASAQGRLTAKKPTPEYEDVFGGLTTSDMTALISRFQAMKVALEAAGDEADPVKACSLLVAIFGSDFPVPPPEDTGKRTKAPAIVTSSASG